jgi:hypothetical protein
LKDKKGEPIMKKSNLYARQLCMMIWRTRCELPDLRYYYERIKIDKSSFSFGKKGGK